MKNDTIKEFSKNLFDTQILLLVTQILLLVIVLLFGIFLIVDSVNIDNLKEQNLELQSQLNKEKIRLDTFISFNDKWWNDQRQFNTLVNDKIGVFNRPPEIKGIEVNISG